MNVLLDHNVPRTLRTLLPSHSVSTAREQGWERLSNGELMKTAANAGFEALLTTDANLPYQQNESSLPLRVIVMLAHRNTLQDLVPLVPLVLEALAKPGPQLIKVGHHPD